MKKIKQNPIIEGRIVRVEERRIPSGVSIKTLFFSKLMRQPLYALLNKEEVPSVTFRVQPPTGGPRTIRFDGNLTADLANNEYIHVWGRERAGNIEATRIYNVTTSSWVERRRDGCGIAITYGCVLLLICLVIFAIFVVLQWKTIASGVLRLFSALLPLAVLVGILYYWMRKTLGFGRRRQR